MVKNLDKNKCTGCKICVKVCPEDVLRFDEASKKANVAYLEDCIACGVCAWFCPAKCIKITVDSARPEVMAY